MNSVFDYLCLRKPRLDYISPPICCDFSGSGFPVIVLDPFGRILAPTGLILGGDGNLTLSWDPYFGALCFNIYQAVDANNSDGEYVIIAECVEGNSFQLPPGPGFYRVSVITPEGESELSTPIQVIGGGGGVCPTETGTDTLCGLLTPENTLIGNLSFTPTNVAETQYFATVPLGRYKVVYDGGAYKYEGNPNPGDYRIQQFFSVIPGTSDTPWLNANICLHPTVAAVEACIPVGDAHSSYGAGQLGVRFANGGDAVDYTGGSVMFSGYKIGSYPAFPEKLRIIGYHPTFFNVSALCSEAVDSAEPVWDGTFPTPDIDPPFIFQWENNSAPSISGKSAFFLRVQYFDSHPTNGSGCGWRIFVSLDGVDLWVGIKGIDNTPQGRYYRTDGCSLTPECLSIESY